MIEVFQRNKRKLWFSSAVKNLHVIKKLNQGIKLNLKAWQARLSDWISLNPVTCTCSVHALPLFKSPQVLFVTQELLAVASNNGTCRFVPDLRFYLGNRQTES